jgi:hypothetical protein
MDSSSLASSLKTMANDNEALLFDARVKLANSCVMLITKAMSNSFCPVDHVGKTLSSMRFIISTSVFTSSSMRTVSGAKTYTQTLSVISLVIMVSASWIVTNWLLSTFTDAQVERLLQFYHLRDCGTKIDNLNRFLAFIGQ